MIEALEPVGAFFEWRDGGDERLDLNLSGSHQFYGARILTGGCTGALQANLTRDDFLQREVHVGCDIADEDDRAAFASGVNGCSDRFGTANAFERHVDALIVG